MVEKLDETSLEWRGNAPVAPEFDDVYYSEENGLDETDFVFLKGIGAPEIWQNSERFVIAETGFGTGLNFLATYQAWLNSGANGRLVFISTEKFPLSEDALEKAHATFPELKELSAQLRSQWPAPEDGFHPRYFADGKVELLLLFGDCAQSYSELDASVDAWFLDGFAPAKNPEMWSDKVFDQIARLSKPGTTFATFTAAGFVKRGLRDRGFNVQKTRGYGRKRDRLVGTFEIAPTHILPKRIAWAPLPAPAPEGPIAIIGSGIAGASLAHALKRKGKDVTVFSSPTAPTASHVPAAIMAPGFQLGDHPATRFITSGFIHACSFPSFQNAFAEVRGATLTSGEKLEKEKHAKLALKLNWGDDWIDTKDGNLTYVKAGSLCTETALKTLLSSIKITEEHIEKIEQSEGNWHLSSDKNTYKFSTVIIAAGAASQVLNGSSHWSLTPKSGQIETLKTTKQLPEKSTAFGGYVTASINGKQTIGSTFEASENLETSESATKEILEKLDDHLNIQLDKDVELTAWKGLRTAPYDYQPFVGAVPNWDDAKEALAPLAKTKRNDPAFPITYQRGLYVIAGFGSKGYQQAPLAAEYLAAMICGDPIPLPIPVQARLHLLRHLVKKVITV